MEIEKFVIHRSWRKHTTRLKRPLGEGRAGNQQGQDIPFSGAMAGVLWGSLNRMGLVNLNQKNRVLLRFMGVFCKGQVRESPGGQEVVSHMGCWASDQGLTFACDDVAAVWGMLAGW